MSLEYKVHQLEMELLRVKRVPHEKTRWICEDGEWPYCEACETSVFGLNTEEETQYFLFCPNCGYEVEK